MNQPVIWGGPKCWTRHLWGGLKASFVYSALASWALLWQTQRPRKKKKQKRAMPVPITSTGWWFQPQTSRSQLHPRLDMGKNMKRLTVTNQILHGNFGSFFRNQCAYMCILYVYKYIVYIYSIYILYIIIYIVYVYI